MTKSNKYSFHKFNLTECQIKSIEEAVRKKSPIVLRLSKKAFKEGNVDLPLTKIDVEHIAKNEGFNYSLNKSKLKLFKLSEGGILPFLIPLIAGLAALGTTGATIAKTVIDKKAADIKQEEEIRHNTELEKIARGDGIYLNPDELNKLGEGIKEFVNNSKLDPIGKKALRNILTNLRSHFKIERQGNGLYLFDD
jgi:hypothetical protein